jgi:ABC-type multidrug transport system fused ATPase/permease subunit
MLISDFTLLIVLTFGLMFVDIQLATIILLYFSTIAVALYFLMNKKAEKLGKLNREFQINVNEMLQTGIRLQKELTLRGRRFDFTEKICAIRYNLAEIEAARSFLPHLTKYVIESSLLLGILILSAFVFMKNDAIHAASMLTLFLAAALRIAPAVLRIQQQTLNIKVSSGIADQALNLLQISKLDSVEQDKKLSHNSKHVGFRGSVSAQNLSFKYSSNEISSVSKVNIDITEGEFVAIVGPSGSGKTTLLNLILGIIEPTEGSILVSGMKPVDAVKKWPGAIGYVPQEIYIVPSNFPENIAIGYDVLEIDPVEVERTLKFTQLFDESIGMNSAFNSLKLSGGQKQRLGIARASYTNPFLLLLDESTSALDAASESLINSSLQSLHGKVTVITIAHRLSTVRNADKIVYMDRGKILSIGSFNEVRKAVPDFDTQASLMGL